MANPVYAIGAALALGGLGGFAHAQEPDPNAANEIIVEAPRSVPLPRQRSSFTGAPIVTTTVKIPVRYDDLDLTSADDRARLMARVERVAEDACKELDWLYPLNTDPECVRNTLAKSTAAARATIAAATAGQ